MDIVSFFIVGIMLYLVGNLIGSYCVIHSIIHSKTFEEYIHRLLDITKHLSIVVGINFLIFGSMSIFFTALALSILLAFVKIDEQEELYDDIKKMNLPKE